MAFEGLTRLGALLSPLLSPFPGWLILGLVGDLIEHAGKTHDDPTAVLASASDIRIAT